MMSDESPLPRHLRFRAFFACGVLLACFGALVCRLFHLQVVCHAEYKREAWLTATALRPQAVRRGNIYDVNKVLLATSFQGNAAPSSLAIDWDFLRENRRDDYAMRTLLELAAVIALPPGELAAVLGQVNEAERAGRKLHWLSLKNRLSPEKTLAVTSYLEIYEKVRGRFWRQGVILDVAPGRHYTFAEGHPDSWRYRHLCREIVGMVDAYGSGMVGAEGAFDALLRGEPGWVEEQEGPIRDFLRHRPGEGGGVGSIEPLHVYLTIDTRLQRIVVDALREQVELQNMERASAIIMDPHTGRLLACATWPRQSQADAIFTLYEPGSIFKAFVAAEALVERKVSVPGPVLWPGGRFRVIPGRTKAVEDVHPGTNMTFVDGFVRSSNIVFSIVAERLGAAGMRRMVKRFALTDEVPQLVDELWPVRASEEYKPWRLREPLGKQDVISMGWGNAVHVSGLTLARAYGVLVNGGYLVVPHMLSALQPPGGGMVDYPVPERRRVIADSSVLATMQDLLRRVIEDEHGTGHRLQVPGLTFGGKTGTAKKWSRGHVYNTGLYTGGFIAHAPAENPRYVVVVKVDLDMRRFTGRFYYGSWTAGPIVQAILQAVHRVPVE